MTTWKSNNKRYNCSGVTLIELMISQIIAVIVLSATLGLIAPAISGFATNAAVSDMQESGRIALDHLDHSIRQAGYRGCNPKANLSNVIDSENLDVSATLRNWAYEDYRIRGFDAEDSDSINALLGTDWLRRRLRHEDTFIGDLLMIRETKGREFRVAYHDMIDQTISFEGDVTDQLASGQIIELNDCHQATTLQIDRISNPVYRSSSDSTLVHYGPDTSANCPAVIWNEDNFMEEGSMVLLGGAQGASCASESSRGLYSEYQFASGTSAHKVYSSIYYLGGRDGSAETYLYRTGTADDGVRVYTEALVEGVENIRLLYGIDLNADGTPDDHWDANRLNVDLDNWSRVVSVKIWLAISSVTAHASSPDGPSFEFPDRSGEMINCDSNPEVSAFICPPSHRPHTDDNFFARRVIHKEIYIRNTAS